MKVTEYFVGLRAPAVVLPAGGDRVRDQGPPARRLREDPGMTNLEEVDPADEARLYRDKPFHPRLLVAVAGRPCTS